MFEQLALKMETSQFERPDQTPEPMPARFAFLYGITGFVIVERCEYASWQCALFLIPFLAPVTPTTPPGATFPGTALLASPVFSITTPPPIVDEEPTPFPPASIVMCLVVLMLQDIPAFRVSDMPFIPDAPVDLGADSDDNESPAPHGDNDGSDDLENDPDYDPGNGDTQDGSDSSTETATGTASQKGVQSRTYSLHLPAPLDNLKLVTVKSMPIVCIFFILFTYQRLKLFGSFLLLISLLCITISLVRFDP